MEKVLLYSRKTKKTTWKLWSTIYCLVKLSGVITDNNSEVEICADRVSTGAQAFPVSRETREAADDLSAHMPPRGDAVVQPSGSHSVPSTGVAAHIPFKLETVKPSPFEGITGQRSLEWAKVGSFFFKFLQLAGSLPPPLLWLEVKMVGSYSGEVTKGTCLCILEKKHVDTKGKREGGMNWEIDTDIYTRLCVKWITSENFLCSTGNSTQSSVVT